MSKMNIMRKAIKVEIENNEYDLVLDFESAMVFQDLYNESIFLGIDKIIQKQDIKALACLIASCLKDEDGCVGMEFVKEIDLMNGLPFFMEKIGEFGKMNTVSPDIARQRRKGTAFAGSVPGLDS